MVNKVIFNASSKFDSWIIKLQTRYRVWNALFVNKAQVLSLFTYIYISFDQILLSIVDNVIYKHNELVYFVCHDS